MLVLDIPLVMLLLILLHLTYVNSHRKLKRFLINLAVLLLFTFYFDLSEIFFLHISAALHTILLYVT